MTDTKPQTTRQKFEKMLTDRGMFESQASKVMDIAAEKLKEDLPNYRITWQRPSSEYDDVFYTSFFATRIKGIAAKWIDDNLPQAWFKEMFI